MSYAHFDESNRSRSFELPGARPHYNPDRPGQVEHIALDLVIELHQQRFHGTCQIRLNPVRSGITSLTLDAVNMHVESVKIADADQPFDCDGEQLHVTLHQPTTAGTAIELTISYAVERPQRGLYFVLPTNEYPRKPIQVWTQGEDEDSRFWFPCFDYPGQLATSEIRVRVPKPLIAISNGELVATEDLGDDRIYHWMQRQVHPTYLMTLAAGDFAEITDDWRGKPVTYYVDKSRAGDALRSMGKTPQMIEFFSQYFGYDYPFPKYAQACVADFIFGGMENTSTTLLTDRCLLDERAALDNRNTESLVAHELAHQWFGDLVVIKHWSHAWIKEGMASYSEVLWVEREYGEEEAAYYRLGELRSYLSEDRGRYRRPIVTNVYREAIELYDRHLYEKGACVYHMIRAELGDDLFKQAIATFVRDNAHRTVETVDLLRAIETATGRNLQPLFDRYVYRGGHPDFKVGYSWDGESNLAKVTITQTQAKDGNTIYDRDLFELKIAIGFAYVCDGNPELKTVAVQVKEKEQSFYFPLESKPQFISFDVGNPILKTVELEYPVTEIKAQLQFDPDPISRIYAAQALAKKGGLEAAKALVEALKRDRFWGVRAEVAEQLGSLKSEGVFEGLVAGLQDGDARVRRAVVEALANTKTRASYKAVKSILKHGDPSYYVEATAARAIGAIGSAKLDDGVKEEKVLKKLTEVLETKAGWNEVVRSGAIGGLSRFKGSEAALDAILVYTAAGTPQPLRLTAIRALGTVSTGQTPGNVQRILDRLSTLAGEAFFLTQVAVVGALSQMETVGAIAIVGELSQQTPDGRVRRIAEEAISKIQQNLGGDRSVQQLRDELEQLKKENQDLRNRLDNLEAKAK